MPALGSGWLAWAGLDGAEEYEAAECVEPLHVALSTAWLERRVPSSHSEAAAGQVGLQVKGNLAKAVKAMEWVEARLATADAFARLRFHVPNSFAVTKR